MILLATRRFWLAAIPVIACAGLGTSLAQAAGWPQFGGDPARSGTQQADEGRAPVRSAWAAVGGDVRTSVLITGGDSSTQRAVYGTADGRLHVRQVESGAVIGLEEGVSVDDGDPDADVFSGRGGSVGLVNASEAGEPGQVLVVHNDENSGGSNDLALAQVDAATGLVVQDVRLPATRDYTISSSPVITPPTEGTSERAILFLANDGTKTTLFRVPVSKATTGDATFGVASSRDVAGADPLASPSLVTLNDAAGVPTLYVAVGTNTLTAVQTFTASSIAATPTGAELGPRSGELGGDAQTPSARPGEPFLYTAVQVDDGRTVVHKLAQDGNTQTLSSVSNSGPLAGAPAPALAVGRRVAVTTSGNLYLLETDNLGRFRAFSGTSLAGSTSGFGRTTASLAGPLVHVARDDGEQLVLTVADAERLRSSDFQQRDTNADATASFGQPSLARGFVGFASDRGVFFYRSACAAVQRGTRTGDRLTGTAAGDDLAGLGGRDSLAGRLGDDCLSGDGGDDRLTGGAGSDVLGGGRGDDRLEGGNGVNRYSAGTGDDTVKAANGVGNERINCGRGADAVTADPSDRVARNCERVRTTRAGSSRRRRAR